jgi:uncharacterized C2H2 Zn-finger protein
VAPYSELVPLFGPIINDVDWKRVVNFIYSVEGVPGSICTTCYTQIDWFCAFQKQIYENDCYLRTTAVKYEDQFNVQELENAGQEIEEIDTETADFTSQKIATELPNGTMDEAMDFPIDTTDERATYGTELDSIQGSSDQLYENVNVDTTTSEPTCQYSSLKVVNKDNAVGEIEGDLEHDTNNMAESFETSKGEDGSFAFRCGKIFKYKHNLITHEKTHDVRNQNDLKCQYCAKKFSRSDNKERHEKSVHEGFSYKCPLCGKIYSRKDHFLTHSKKFHPEANVKPIEEKRADK